MDTAPILLFVYNRPAHTRQALEALSRNTLAAASDVFVYSDAARSEADCAAVEEVRHIVREAKGFRQVHVTEREQNWGLARNIIDGVTTMVNRYGRVIVLEDDLVVAPHFLRFMNDALDIYADVPQVGHIPATLPMTRVCLTRSLSNGPEVGGGPLGNAPGSSLIPTGKPYWKSSNGRN